MSEATRPSRGVGQGGRFQGLKPREDELAADHISIRDLVERIAQPRSLPNTPSTAKGRVFLLLQRDRADDPIHVVWGIPEDTSIRPSSYWLSPGTR